MPLTSGAGARPRRLPSRLALVMGLVAVLSAGVLGWGLLARFPQEGFVFLYMPLIAAAAYFRGRGAGIATGAISLVAARYFIVRPVHSFAVAPGTVPLVFAFAAFVALVVEVAARMRLAEADAYRFGLLVQSSDDAIFSKLLDGTILTWNKGAERLYGYTAAEAIGRPVSMLVPPDRLDELSSYMSRLRRGERLEHFDSVRRKKDGTRIDVSVSISPVVDAAGWIVAASTIARDISDRKRVERQGRFLVDANQVLTSSLDVQTTLDAVARLAVPALADWCTIELAADDGGLSHIAVMHRDPAKAALARESQRAGARSPDAQPSPVLRTGRSALYPELSPELLAEAVPDSALRDIFGGLRSALAVPLVARGRVIGALSLLSGESARRYDPRDLAFAEQLAHQAALAIDNARLLQAEQAARRGAERVADRIGRLQALTAALSEALTPAQVADVILHQVVDDLGAAAAAVVVRADDARPLELLSATGYSADVLERWQSTPGDIQPVTAAMRSGRVVWFASWAEFQARYPEAIAPREEARLGARAAVPLMLRGRPVGALYMNFKEPRTFPAAELDFMLTLGRQCAQAVDRARSYAREHEIATTLQQALLPVQLPRVPGLDIHVAYLPAAAASEVGGDWYDVFQLPDGGVALGVGDVVGHGLEAAATMGEARHAIRTAVLGGHDPGTALVIASKVLQLHRDKAMATAVAGVLDPVRREFTYAAAGHPAPIVATAERIETLESGGPPLGILERPVIPVARVSLPPGALLVLYTDGLVEYARDYIGGEAALLRAVRHEQAAPSANQAQAILDHVLPGGPARDDIAIIAVRLERQPAEPLDVTLPAEATSLARMRHLLDGLAQALGLDDALTLAVQVAVGEAATNVIQHAYDATPGTVRLRARGDGRVLRVEVEDHGRWRPERPGVTGVHGLAMMRALADAVDVETAEHGTTVRLEFSTARPADSSAPPPSARREAIPFDAPPEVHPDGPRAPDAGGTRPPLGGLELHRRSAAGVPVVDLTGALDLSTMERLVPALEHASADAQRVVILSLDAATYIDTHGIRALLEARRALARSGHALALVVPRGSTIHRILTVAGVRPLFRVFDSVGDAVAESSR